MKDKRFLVFGIYRYYPSGGMDDLNDSFETVEEAVKHTKEIFDKYDSVDIYDRIEGVSLNVDLSNK